MQPSTSQALVDYLSYSAMTTLLRNPYQFRKKYVLKVYDDIKSPSAVVGDAGHVALAKYYEGMGVDQAITAGLKKLNSQSDTGIDYGKTGSRAKMIEQYTQAINFYFQELPTYHEILGVELGLVKDIETIHGEKLGLPAKSFTDLVTRDRLGNIELIDHKFTTRYSDETTDNFGHIIQAMFNYHTIKAEMGEAPARMIFQECKISKNKDNTPQIQPYVIEFNGPSSASDFALFYQLYEAVTDHLSDPNARFLPNPFDMFDGAATMEQFRDGIFGIDRPTAVQRKTEQVAFKERSFVASAYDSPENVDLTMEERIRLKLQEFGVVVEAGQTHVGPSVTQYTMKPARGVPMTKVLGLHRDLALALQARSVRVEAPMPGTNLIGIEVPSKHRSVIEMSDSHLRPGTMQLPIGVNVMGEMIYKDLTDMPHLLIAGATGAGKSVMLNVIIKSLTKQLIPEQLELVLIDPKQVEFAPFDKLPHLAMPVVYNNKAAAEVLEATVKEMEERYKSLRRRHVRTIAEYNAKGGKMPYRVVILDEFADLMMSAEKQPIASMDIKMLTHYLKDSVLSGSGRITQAAVREAIKATAEAGPPPAEQSVIRIAQKARAVGIHLILATQRPSADVVTGLIKANLPTKIAFMVSTGVNSKIILDETGAEELTGKGDMLFQDPSHNGLQRLQGVLA